MLGRSASFTSKSIALPLPCATVNSSSVPNRTFPTTPPPPVDNGVTPVPIEPDKECAVFMPIFTLAPVSVRLMLTLLDFSLEAPTKNSMIGTG